jgi:hypothetical protein
MPNKNVPISAKVPPYYRFVVEGLIGSKFKSKSDAVSRMMGDWIERHRDDLERLHLEEKDFLRPRATQAGGPLAGESSERTPVRR